MTKTKVLQVGPLPPPIGGISTFIDNLRKYADMDVELDYFNIFPKKDKPLNKKVFNLVVLFKYFFYLLWKKPDIVHIHTAGYRAFTKSSYFVKISKWLNKKVILHVHSGRFMEYYDEAGASTKKMVIDTFEASDRVVCLSESWKQRFTETFPVDSAKYEVIPNAIFAEEFEEIRPAFSYDSKTVLYVGKLSENKGIYDIVEMAKKLKDDDSIQFRLMGDGPLKSYVEHEANQHDLNIELLGSLSGKAKIRQFDQADIFLLPSYFEGLSITVLEAMAAGLVVLTTKVGALPDVVEDGRAGHLFEPGDVDGFTRQLSSLSQEEMERISSYNIEEAKEYSFDRLLERLERLYRVL
ncbi:glycosyltransferase family 1 protein [Halobacillus fulvus]|nr:glycosyltransferase family 1 protein [Halobacillus fulvus]